MSLIKICGIKQAETVALLKSLQVDYVGFVFANSKRQVSAAEAGQILCSIEHPPKAVGVFVNPSMEELAEVLEQVPLAVIQLHGQESPAFCDEVKQRFGLDVWKAIAVGDEGADKLELAEYNRSVDAFLFDTYDPTLAGGTGKRFTWEQIPLLKQQAGSTSVIIAGGLAPENVTELVSTYAPTIIDVSSGVETDGQKDPEKIKTFVQRVREHDKHNTKICNITR